MKLIDYISRLIKKYYHNWEYYTFGFRMCRNCGLCQKRKSIGTISPYFNEWLNISQERFKILTSYNEGR